jgi:membrane-associated phospholipid phosphatase
VICDGTPPNAVDDFFRTALRRPDTKPASVASDVFGYGLAPASAFGLEALAAIADRRADEAPLDLVLVAQATAVDVALHQGMIAVLRRERPAFHAIADRDAKEAARAPDSLSSFPSGHTGAAFTLAAAAGTIASMRGYRLAPLIWIVGMTVATATAYFRMAADQHYFTDTLAGAGLGVGVGIGVPVLFHGPEGTSPLRAVSIGTTPVARGRVASVAVAF